MIEAISHIWKRWQQAKVDYAPERRGRHKQHDQFSERMSPEKEKPLPADDPENETFSILDIRI